MTFATAHGNLKMALPSFDISVGKKLKAIVRPESIDIVGIDSDVYDAVNVLEGRVESAMYIGSIIRYTIRVGNQTLYQDELDPQYKNIFEEGNRVKLILKKRIHMFNE